MIDDIDSSESTLRLLASESLKKWSLKGVLKLLTDDDYIVRTLAARELQIRGDHEIYDYVVDLVKDDKDYIREIAAFVLGQLATPKMPFKDNSVPLLLNLITDESYEVRATTAASLGHLCFEKMPEDVEVALLKASNDCNSDVRACTGYALGNSTGSEEVIQTLRNLLKDESKEVRDYAELGLDILKE